MLIIQAYVFHDTSLGALKKLSKKL